MVTKPLVLKEGWRITKFLLVGGGGFLINIGCMGFFNTLLGINYILVSGAIILPLDALYQYISHNYWTFTDRRSTNHWLTATKFVGYNIFYFGILISLTEIAKVPPIISVIVAVGFLLPLKYAVSYFWIWKEK